MVGYIVKCKNKEKIYYKNSYFIFDWVYIISIMVMFSRYRYILVVIGNEYISG